MQAIIYCRVSTKEQAEKGYSLEGQEKDCRQFALNQGLEVVKVFVERGESAKTQDRTQFKNLIQYCVQNKRTLRSRHSGERSEHGCGVQVPVRPAALIILDALKQVQSDEIKEEYRIEKELKELNDQLERVEELAIKGTFDDDTYKRKSDKLKSEILAKQVELNETTMELNNTKACLNYCKFFRMNIAHLWSVADINLKQRFQTLIFPDRITYHDNGTLGTTATAYIFKQWQGQMSRESHLVAPDRYTLKQILQEIETIFALREFLPANIAVPA